MRGNYDNSAPFYDRLSRLIFGRALINAPVHFLPLIPANSSVLIVGGGTGWILEEIARVHPFGLSITYVEISARMTDLSRKRNVAGNHVVFINQPVQDVSLSAQDVVITPFLFDNFTEANVPPLFDHIHQQLKPGGIWLNTDFQISGKWWQHVLLKSMLLFFKVLCGVESWRLPDADKQFQLNDYVTTGKQTFYGDFVVTRCYRK